MEDKPLDSNELEGRCEGLKDKTDPKIKILFENFKNPFPILVFQCFCAIKAYLGIKMSKFADICQQKSF